MFRIPNRDIPKIHSRDKMVIRDYKIEAYDQNGLIFAFFKNNLLNIALIEKPENCSKFGIFESNINFNYKIKNFRKIGFLV